MGSKANRADTVQSKKDGFKKLADEKFQEALKNPTLSPRAVADLLKSGILEKEALAAGFRDPVGNEMYAYCGENVGGYIIAYGDTGFARAKLLDHWVPKASSKPRKYAQKVGTSPQLYLPQLDGLDWEKIFNDESIPLYITEGEKKAFAAVKVGLACVGLGGVDCFRVKNGPLQEWDRIALVGRNVYIVYDSDAADKPNVQQAEASLAIFLEGRGAKVQRIRLPQLSGNDKTGLDDFLVHHGLPADTKKARTAFDALTPEPISFVEAISHFTEVDNANRFVRKYRDEVRYVYDQKKWLFLDTETKLWSFDKTGEASRRVLEILDELQGEVRKIKDKEVRNQILKGMKSCKTARHLKAVVDIVAVSDGLSINTASLDSDLFCVALPDGQAIDLNTMAVRQAVPEDYFSKHLDAVYDPEAQCPLWEGFLLKFFDGDKDLISFIQRAVGYSLTGDNSAQCLFIAYGTGSNGKSTFLNTLLKLMGGYGINASPETFMVRKNQSSTRDDLLRIQNARFIVTSELEENERFAEAFIKRWTGGEEIVARGIYNTDMGFQPRGKIWLGTNHKPKIYGTDWGIWRRMNFIPFNVTISDEEKDERFSEKLLPEMSGILNWALKGFTEWKKHGLAPPASVVEATKEYRGDMDVLGTWLRERCVVSKNAQVLISQAYDDYRVWIKEVGETFTMNQRDFSKRIQERKFEKKQTTDRATSQKGWFFTGFDLIANGNQKISALGGAKG